MQILELTLEGFRNYGRASVAFDPDCNVIFGENAQGKTNLLESIVYLSCGKSPRARTDREMIGFDASAAVLESRTLSRDREFRTRVELYRGRRRKMWVNQVPAKNSAAPVTPHSGATPAGNTGRKKEENAFIPFIVALNAPPRELL